MLKSKSDLEKLTMILLEFTWKEYLKSKKQRPKKLDHLCLTETGGTEKTKDKTKNNYTTPPKIMTVSSIKECAAHIEQETN